MVERQIGSPECSESFMQKCLYLRKILFENTFAFEAETKIQ